ncbi:MAG: cupin domain-containing protein [Pseudomonadota bacterium]
MSDFLEPVGSDAAFFARMAELGKNRDAAVFKLRCRLPTQGRADMVAAATPTLSIVLKAYASGGENTLHAHHNEDHAFIVLQGFATFYGERDAVLGKVGRLEGIMIPQGALYRFEAGTEEPLVLLRVGSILPGTQNEGSRRSADGSVNDSFSAKNKTVELILSADRMFG